MLKIKVSLLLLFSLSILSLLPASAQKQQRQKASASRLAAYRDNSCVACHSRLAEPLRVSAHFFEWLNSSHEQSGVSCEKCHGGNPSSNIVEAAHRGVTRATFVTSTLHAKNLPETCGSCHREVVSAFVKSKHYQLLQSSGSAPSCTTCHHHMATTVIYWPPETTLLCASCHDKAERIGPVTSEIAQQAGDVIAAFLRGDEVIDWSHYLISEAEKKKRRFPAQKAELIRLAEILKEAKLSFHAFDLKASRRKADLVFERGTKVKDFVWPKVE